MKKESPFLKFYGLHASLALFKARKNAIERVYCLEDKVPFLKELLKWCATAKIPYHIVKEDDLSKLTESTHHEGVCVVAAPHPDYTLNDLLADYQHKRKGLVIFLNQVENPHNLGAIVRTCAHFGVTHIITDASIRYSPACCRIAQGGVESVHLIHIKNVEEAFFKLKAAGFDLLGTSSHQGKPLRTHQFCQKTLFVMGSESKGIDETVAKQLMHYIKIEGSDAVESLNVSNAAALCCYGYYCQHGLSS